MQEKKNTIVNFSLRFKSLCESSGKTQKELAKLLEISEPALINYKRERVPEPEALLRIAKFFDVSIEWLLTGSDLTSTKNSPQLSSSIWKVRAEEAEKKIAAMKAGLSAFIKKF